MKPGRSRIELYDIPRDPTQLNNAADKHPDVVERLAGKVLAWQKTLPPGPMDPGAGKDDYPWPGKGQRPSGRTPKKAWPGTRPTPYKCVALAFGAPLYGTGNQV